MHAGRYNYRPGLKLNDTKERIYGSNSIKSLLTDLMSANEDNYDRNYCLKIESVACVLYRGKSLK